MFYFSSPLPMMLLTHHGTTLFYCFSSYFNWSQKMTSYWENYWQLNSFCPSITPFFAPKKGSNRLVLSTQNDPTKTRKIVEEDIENFLLVIPYCKYHTNNSDYNVVLHLTSHMFKIFDVECKVLVKKWAVNSSKHSRPANHLTMRFLFGTKEPFN